MSKNVFNDSIDVLSANTVTKSKTSYMKNSAGETLWYIKVTGTFTYGNGSSKCTSVTPNAVSKNKNWKVSGIKGQKNNATAKATATGKQYYDGHVINTYTETVSLTCSATGQFS